MTTTAEVLPIGAIYAEGRRRLGDLVLDAGDEGGKATVPVCPGWTVHDVMAHVVGVCADVLSGNIAGVATDPWTAAQVEARRERTMAELVTEWSQLAPQVEAFAGDFPNRVGEQWIADLTTHEHDVRGALGRPGARDSEGVAVGLGFLVELGLAGSLQEKGIGALSVRAGDRSWVVGDGEPAGAVEAEPFELFRGLTGRRSAAQIRSWSWTVDPGPWLPAFQYGPFTTSPVDIEE